MPRERLTLPRIAAFNPKSESILWDVEVRRLGVRARPTGAKSFLYKGALKYENIRITIGSTKTWTIEAAREQARSFQRMIDQGRDPRDVLREQSEAAAAAEAATKIARETADTEAERQRRYTLRALCNAYTEHLDRAGKGKSAAATRSAFKCHVFTNGEIADTPASRVTAHEVAAMVRKVREAGKERAAGTLRSYLSAAYNVAKRAPFDSAISADLIPFGIEHNPVDAIPAIAVQRGDRRLSSIELRNYIKSLGDDLPDQALKIALLAGGQRMAQLLRAKVGDFDPDNSTLRLWDGKGKRTSPREHLLPLAPRAAALVAGLAERAKSKNSSFLFSTHGKVVMTFTTPGKRAAEISTTMGGTPFNLRDIRRTAESELSAMGISKDTRAQLLSHGISGVQAAHYDRHDYISEKRAALAAWEAKLDAIEKGLATPTNGAQLRNA